MKKLLMSLAMICTVSSNIYAAIDFADVSSSIGARNGKIDFRTTVTISGGTLTKYPGAQLGGNQVRFVEGFFDDTKSKTKLDGKFNPTTLGVILTGSQRYVGSSGTVSPQINISGNNNTIQGDVKTTSPITMQGANPQLTVAVTNVLNQSISPGGGAVTLDQNLTMGDGAQFLSPGTIIFGGRRLSLGGSPLTAAVGLLLKGAQDMQFNSTITLTSDWYFDGDAHVSGNGNILDISQSGSIYIKPNTNLHMTSMKIRGLGGGSFVFEDDTSELSLSFVEIEMDDDYTVTIGGIRAEGPTNIVTKDHLLRFSLLGSLTVDGIRLTYDTTTFTDQQNIRPFTLGQEGSYVACINNGIVGRVVDATTTNSLSQQITNNSNALLYLTKNTSNALLSCCKNTSNTLLFLTTNNSNALIALNNNNSNAILNCCKNMSNTLLYLNKNNSNALLRGVTNNSNAIMVLFTQVNNNSNAILNCCKNMSNTLLYLTKNNSDAIIELTTNNSMTLLELANNNSNAILNCCKNMSNTLLYLTKNNSDAIIELTTNNSMTLLELANNNSNAILNCCKNMSNTLLYLNNNNSNAIQVLSTGLKNTSNASLAQNKNNSNAILNCCKNMSNTLLYLNKNNSNTLLSQNKNNSNAILNCCKNMSNTLLYLNKNNSNTLLSQNKNNSNAILNCCKNMSNTLLYLNKNNSNTLLSQNKNNSNAILNCCKNMSNTLLYLNKNNSNTLLSQNKNNSNAILNCCKNMSNTLLFLTKNNSNTLLSQNKNNSNTLLYLNKNMSNALLNCCKNMSNTLLYLTKNNSDAIIELTTNNSMTLLELANNNSNAILNCCKNMSNTLLYLTKNNSDAIIELTTNNSMTLLELANNNSNAILYLTKNNSNAIIACCTNPLADACITTTKLLNKDIEYSLFDVTTVCSNATIDGRGQMMHFSAAEHPQIVINKNVILTLKNVTLANIQENTFDIRSGARILIDNDVMFHFAQDITFSQGFIHLLNGDAGFNVFKMCGDCGRRKIEVSPLVGSGILLELGTNTLQLSQMELIGLQHISISSGLIEGAIALSGESAVDIDVNTDMNFVIEHYGNYLYLLADNLTLSGAILFGDFPSNILNMRSIIASPIANKPGVKEGNPVVNFTGDPGVFLTSNSGIAGLIIEDLTLSLNNASLNGFVIDFSSFLSVKRLEVLGNPIKQSSSEFRLEAVQLSGKKIDTAFVRAPIVPPVTALHLLHQQEQEAFEALSGSHIPPVSTVRPEQVAPSHGSSQPAVKPSVKPIQERPRTDARKEKERDDARQSDRNADDRAEDSRIDAVSRSTAGLDLPETFDLSYVNATVEPDAPLSQNILLDHAILKNFSVNAGDFNLTMSDGSRVEMRGLGTVELLPNHVINVIGKGNELVVTGEFRLNDNIHFQVDSELTVIIKQIDEEIVPQVVIPTGVELLLTRRAALRFDALNLDGPVVMEDGASILLAGVRKNNVVTSRPILSLLGGARLDVQELGLARVHGIGTIKGATNGGIGLSKIGALVIGGGLSSTDDIILDVSSSGIVELKPEDPSAQATALLNTLPADQKALRSKARISWQKTAGEMKFDRAGLLSIGSNGIYEVNASGDTSQAGKIRQISFRAGGAIDIALGGKFTMGPNKQATNTGSTSLIPQGAPFVWDGNGAEIAGQGLVQFVGNIGGFSAQLGILPDRLFSKTTFTANDLISLLAHKNNVFLFAVWFKDVNGNSFLRTSTGVIVPLTVNEVITDEPNADSVIGRNVVTGVQFTIDKFGIKTNNG